MINSSAEPEHRSVEYKQEVSRQYTQTTSNPTNKLKRQTKQTVGRRTCASTYIIKQQHADRSNAYELLTSKQPQAHIDVLNTDKIAHQCTSASLASQDYGTRTKELNMLRLHLNQGTAAKDPNMLSQSLSIIYEFA